MSQTNQAQYLQQLGSQAKQASYALANLSAAQKADLLEAIAEALTQNTQAILAANAKDVVAAKADGLSDAMIDRLLLTESRLAGIIGDISDVVRLADPVGEEFGSRVLDNGLRLTRRRVPLGVIGVI